MPNPLQQRTARKLYTLRQRAETILTKRSQELVDMPVAASQRLMYEFHLQQVEAEMQNEELCQVQAELAAAHDRYADLCDFVPVGYLNLDTVGVILEANLTAEQLLAVPRASMIGRRLINWVAPEAHHTLYCHWQQVFAEDTTHTCNLWMQRQDGTLFYAQLRSRRGGRSVAPWHWRLAFSDLTTPGHAEQQLAWNEALVDASRDAIFGTTLSGTIVRWSAAAERLYGYGAAEMMGRSVDLLVPPERRHEPAYLMAAVQRGERIECYETQCLTKGGTRLDVSMTLSLAQTRNGTVIGTLVIARNITSCKQREAKLQAAEQALRHSHAQLQRLARRQQQIQEHERARMALEIHDEVAQLLTILQIDMVWLMQHHQMSPETHEHLRSMSAQVDDLDKAVHRIATELRPRLLDDLGLLDAIAWQLEDVKRRTGLTYTLQAPSEGVELRLDADRSTTLFRIFQEALTNVMRHAKASWVAVRVSQDAEGVCLELRDNGKGITLTPTPQRHRKSLGLLGMHERAQLWGGDVTIESEAGSGTAVVVRMPYRAAKRWRRLCDASSPGR